MSQLKLINLEKLHIWWPSKIRDDGTRTNIAGF